MPITEFPDPRNASPDGIVAVGGDLHPESLLTAYRQGIFPWPIEVRRGQFALAWFCPPRRAILDFKKIHVPRSLAKARKKEPFRFTEDRAFEKVILHCAKAKRPGQQGTWITPEMIEAYIALHERGFAHSVEAWEGDELVGGIYGVGVEGVFSGESMFHLKPNASKLSLLHLVDVLKGKGLAWMDIQVMTPHMKALGAREISRDAFLRRLAQAHEPASR